MSTARVLAPWRLARVGQPMVRSASAWPHPSCGRRYGSATKSVLSETLTHFRDPSRDREIYLLGTAHVSEESAKEVRELVTLVKPDVLVVELCDKRAAKMRRDMRAAADGRAPSAGGGEMPAEVEGVLRQFLGPLGGAHTAGAFGVHGLGLEAVIKLAFKTLYEVMSKKFGLVPGTDFRAALEMADESRRAGGTGIKLVHGDRDVDKTISLLKGALLQTSIMRVMTTPMDPELEDLLMDGAQGIFSGKPSAEDVASLKKAIENMKDRRHTRLFADHFRKVAPEVLDVMLTQRDHLMADIILAEGTRGASKVVAVVGAAHLDGIEQLIEERFLRK